MVDPVRHNWKFQSGGAWRDSGHYCADKSQQSGYSAGANCFGCGAKIPYDAVGVLARKRTTRRLPLDEFWRTEIRPMAEFACLVEEASK